VKEIDLLAFGSTGPAALLARGLAGDAITFSDIDLNGFDFDQVKDSFDPKMLPGALKYGGIYGLVPLCSSDSGRTQFSGARQQGHYERASAAKNVSLRKEPLDIATAVDDVLGSKESQDRVK
jgi:hypothetical protein